LFNVIPRALFSTGGVTITGRSFLRRRRAQHFF